MGTADPKPVAHASIGLRSDNSWPARLRSFGPAGIVVMIAIPLAGTAFLSAILVLLWARYTGTPWREIGYVRPKSWMRAVMFAFVFGLAFKLVMKALVMPLLGAAPMNEAYHYLVGNPVAMLQMAIGIIVGAGFGEETVYRGFLFERFGKLLKPRAGAAVATIVTVLITSVWFGLVHYPEQGLSGAEQAVITGLVFGTMFTMSASILMPMVAHVAFDLAALAIIYWNLEDPVAHLVFR